MIEAVVVVVPVHDEAERIGACLASIRAAALHPALRAVTVHLVVVLDTCSDDSLQQTVAHLHPVRDRALRVALRNVGAARAEGVLHGLEATGRPADRVWVATTDADTIVPGDWLAVHLDAAVSGSAAVAGVIRVADWEQHPTTVRDRYLALLRSRTRPDGRHTHVYGANLGVLASAYLAVGGFPLVGRGEDVGLWRRLQAGGHRSLATQTSWVTTSARTDPRALGGLGDLLLAMHVEDTTSAVLDLTATDLPLRPTG